MDQSIQRSLTSASALRTNLVKLHRHLESLTAKEEAVIRTNKENESAAVRQEAAEEEHSSDDEFQEVGIAEISNVERKKKPEKLVDKLLPSLKADLLSEYTNASNSLSDLWKSIDPTFVAQVIVPSDLPPPAKQHILLPLLNISVGAAEASCQYSAIDVFRSEANSLTEDEELIFKAKLSQHATNLSKISNGIQQKIALLATPAASNSKSNTEVRRSLKRKLNHNL